MEEASDYQYQRLLKAVAERLEQLVTDHPPGQPRDAVYVLTEIGRVAKVIRAALDKGADGA
jgi:hypothetical protein